MVTATAIGLDALDDLAVGATIPDTGGGGDPYVGALMACQAIERYGPVSLVEVSILPEGLVLALAMMGAPTVLVETISNGGEFEWVVRTGERRLGRPAVALMSVEAFDLHSTVLIVAAAELGLPLLDAVGIGRAFPAIPMCSMHLAGMSAATTESMAYGQRVSGIGMPCTPIWKTLDGLAPVRPRSFGYPCDDVSLEGREADAVPTRH